MSLIGRGHVSLLRFSVITAAIVGAVGLGYAIRSAIAAGVTNTGLSYSGTLLTFGAPDNSAHTMTAGLYVNGTELCASLTTSTTCVNGQFTIPLPAACTTVVQNNANVQVEVIIDGTPMGLTSLAAVPYAVVAGSVSGPVLATGMQQLAASTFTCNSSTAGTTFFDTSSNQFYGCDGANLVAFGSTLGNSSATPGASCNAILTARPGSPSGNYWIAPGGGTAFQAYCDMTTSGGGWTLCFADKYQGKGTDTNSAFNYLTSTWNQGVTAFTRGNASQGSAWGNFCPLLASSNAPPAQVYGVSYGEDNTTYTGGVCTLSSSFFNAGNALVNLSCPSGTSLCSYNKPTGTTSVFGLDYSCAQYNEGLNQGSSLNFNPNNPSADFGHGTIDYTNMHSGTCPVSGDRHCTGGWCYECSGIGTSQYASGNLKTLLLYVR